MYLEQSIDEYPEPDYYSGDDIETIRLEDITTVEATTETREATVTDTGEKTDITFGDPFIFDNLEITFIDEIEWTTVDNQFSEQYGKDVFSVKITIKNLTNETHGLASYSYDQYGSKGLKLSIISGYFSNDDVSYAGNFRAGATLESKMYFLYDGDGDYWIEFHLWSYNNDKKTEVRLPISK